MVKDFAIEMSVGLVCGFVGAAVLVAAVRRLVRHAELFPMLILVLAATLFCLTSFAHGSVSRPRRLMDTPPAVISSVEDLGADLGMNDRVLLYSLAA